jgi:DNA-binding CsgD family transcriptional regulator
MRMTETARGADDEDGWQVVIRPETRMHLVDYELSPLMREAHAQADAGQADAGSARSGGVGAGWQARARGAGQSVAEARQLSAEEAVGLALGVEASGASDGHESSKWQLTRRQIEVARGLTDRQIARRLGISHRTADGRRPRQVSAQLGCSSRTAVAAWALCQETSPSQV